MASQQKRFNHILQHTLKTPISFVGVGLHTGTKVSMTVRPAPANSGICFVRKDLAADGPPIGARWYNVTDTRCSMVIGGVGGVTVASVSSLMAALRGTGVDNALVEIDGPEVPVLDGSARPFVDMIERAGRQRQPAPRWVIWIHNPLSVHMGGRYAFLAPDVRSRVTAEIDVPVPLIGAQKRSMEVGNDFHDEIAPARAFALVGEPQELQPRGLARGGSLHNTVLVDGGRVLNHGGLRFPDELVRHTMLECLGDLALAGVPIFGHYFGYRPGHHLNLALLRKLFSQAGDWTYLTIDDFFDTLLGGREPDREREDDGPREWQRAGEQGGEA